MRGSWFERRWFYPAAVASFVAGHAFDLFGTYVAQPHFEHEANPIYVTLRSAGMRPGWPMVIAGKAIACLVAAWGLRQFLRLRRRYYPEHPASFRELITHFIYGRPLGWIESCFRMPRSVTPSVVSLLAVWSLGGPYFAYLGYGNLASRCGWWRLGGFWAGRYWFDWGLFVWLPVSLAWFCRQLWRDFQGERLAEAPRAAGGAA